MHGSSSSFCLHACAGAAWYAAAAIAAVVRRQFTALVIPGTRLLLGLGASAFTEQVIVAMVARGDASVAGELCCVMVDEAAGDLVVRLSVLLLSAGRTREAAALAIAFFTAARQHWHSTDAVACLLSEAIAQAVGLGHADAVAVVTDHMVQDGQNANVVAIMHKMVASGERGAGGGAVGGTPAVPACV